MQRSYRFRRLLRRPRQTRPGLHGRRVGSRRSVQIDAPGARLGPLPRQGQTGQNRQPAGPLRFKLRS